MKLRGLTSFSIYLLTTVIFTFLYILTSKKPDPFEYSESSPGFVVVLQAIGYAAVGSGKELSRWIKFASFCALINLAFFIALKFVTRLGVKDLIFAVILTLSVSFLIYGFLYPVLQWIFGEYHSVTFTILAVTFFTSRCTIQNSRTGSK